MRGLRLEIFLLLPLEKNVILDKRVLWPSSFGKVEINEAVMQQYLKE